MKTTFAKPAAIAALVAAAAVSPAMADKHNLWKGSAATYDFQDIDNWNVKNDIEKYPNDELGGKYLNISFWKSINTVEAARVEFSSMFTMNGTLTIANYASGNPPLVFTASEPTFGLDLTLSPNNQNKGSIYIAHTNLAYNTSNYYVGLYDAKVEFKGGTYKANNIHMGNLKQPADYTADVTVAGVDSAATLVATNDINLLKGSLTIAGETSVVTSGNNVVVGGIRGANLPGANFSVYMRDGAVLAAEETFFMGGWYNNGQSSTGKIFAKDSKISVGKQMHIAGTNSVGEVHVTNCTVKVAREAVHVGRAANSTGVYDMNGGTLDVEGSFVVGFSSDSTGTALFSGGAKITADTISAGDGTGSVTFDGATFESSASANKDIIPAADLLTVSIAKGGATIKPANNAKIGAALGSAVAEGETDGGVTFAGGKAITVNGTIAYNGPTTVKDNTQLRVDAASAARILQNGLSIVANKAVGENGVAILTISDGSALPETRNISLSGKYAEACIVEEVGDCVKLMPAGLTFYVEDDNIVLNCDFEDSTTSTSGNSKRWGDSGYDNPEWTTTTKNTLLVMNKSGGYVNMSGFGKYACGLQTNSGRAEAWFSQDLELEAGRYEISFEATGRVQNNCFGGVVHVSLIQGTETNGVGRLEVPDRNVKYALTNTVEVAAGGTYALTFWQVSSENTRNTGTTTADAMTMIDNVVVRRAVEKTRGNEWIRESASTAGTTGTWSPAREYESGVISSDGEAVFSPFFGSVGKVVEVRSKLNFNRCSPVRTDMPRTARAAVCIADGEEGAKFMLYTSDENGPKWVEATAPGVDVDAAADYTVCFWFFPKKDEYNAFILKPGCRIQFVDATTGENAFPLATKGGTASIGRIGFTGSGAVESIRGRDALQTGSSVYLR
ncbi:MAG: hypothetical protein IJG18_10250 [Kiritimatiellae bacterium]|nr:hypothetical protein [Kiritimatiellia bacterium]